LEVACIFCECVGDQNVTIVPVSGRDFETAAKRPAFSALEGSRLHRDLGIPQVAWEDALAAHVRTSGLF